MCDKESQAAIHLSIRTAAQHLHGAVPDGPTRSMEVRPMQQNRPVVFAVAVILLLAALAFWRSCSY
jgi:hypothetical protein